MGNASEEPTKPCILVVENDRVYREDFVTNLEQWGYRPVVAEGRGKRLINDAQTKVQEHRCHVALVDMRLKDDYDRNDRSGLELVPNLKPALSIVVSAFGDRETTRKALIEREAFDFVGKEEHPERLHEAIERALQQVGMVNEPDIHWPPGLSSASVVQQITRDETASPNEANQIVRCLFPVARTIRLEHLGGAHQIRPTPSQRSLVMQAWADDLEPVVVKLERISRIEREVQCYQEFIDNRLVGNFYARLRRHHLLWDIGGAVYDLVGTSLQRIDTFSLFYQNPATTEEHIQASMRHLFDEVWSRLYFTTNEPQGGSLCDAYTEVWGPSWQHRVRDFPNQQEALVIASGDMSLEVYNPVVWVRQRTNMDDDSPDRASHDFSKVANARTAITHGDVSGDNLFVDQERIWVIDYERSGRGPILQDFVQLETDILLRLAQIAPDDMPSLLELFIAVLRPRRLSDLPTTQSSHAEVRKAVAVIHTLRELALKLTKVADIQQYFWGVLLNVVFRASFARPDNDIQQQRALLLGGLLCHRLEHLSDPNWPPEAWRPGGVASVPDTGRSGDELSKIRQVLENAFDDEEFGRFCFEHFREVYNRFSDGMSLRTKRQMLIEYCERYGKIPELQEHVRTENLHQYERVFG
jgi:DNA-binding NarL/FixJ family response regulator